ncbi:hypothetical protein [Nocardia abscessus]|uniref:hypothetical protein n=1 Tax=Nocardia abscessus TaxID=120957 RepID=UPI0024551F5F|nr:hypothetical protein [Nocardia abscessus]
MTHRSDNPLDRFHRLDDLDQATEQLPVVDDKPKGSFLDELIILVCGVALGAFFGVVFGLIVWGGGW